MELNTAQAEAVAHGSGPLLVLAGAGSGKTRVLTARIAHLIAEENVAPQEILAVTFTNKAAQEMRDRARRVIGPRAQHVLLSTFHSTCARWLRRHARAAGLRPSFTIHDPDDVLLIVRGIADEMSVPTDRPSLRTYLAAIESWRNGAILPIEAQERAIGRDAELRAEIYAAFDKRLLELNGIDFGGLITAVVSLLETQPGVREDLRAVARHVLVDEFQDTNPAQYRLLRALVEPGGNLCVVGDDDQSIYGWRGAKVDHLLGFASDWPGATVVTLDENYRSTPNILNAAHALVERLPRRLPKRLHTQRASGDPPTLLVAEDDRMEASWVAEAILKDTAASGRRYGDYAVFYRTNAQSRTFEEAFRVRGIAHRIVGGTAFFDRKEIRDLLAWARMAVNPKDDVSFARALQAPPRGIGQASLRKLRAVAAAADLSMSEAVAFAEIRQAFGRTLRSRLAELADLLKEARAHAETDPPSDFFRWVLESTSYLNWLEGQEPDSFEERRLNVGELLNAAHDLTETQESPSLSSFLEAVTLRSAADDVDGAADAVQLMTVHTAKGLEFPVVFVTGLEKDLFPMNTRQRPSTAAALEEESRLGYVALTRARDQLFLCASKVRRRHGQVLRCEPSPFLHEIPNDVLHLHPESSIQALGDWRNHAPSTNRMREDTERWAFDQRPWLASIGAQISGEPVPDEGVLFDDVHALNPEEEAQTAGLAGRSARHNTFGVGRIVSAERSAGKVKVSIEFPKVGRKNVMLEYLKLL